MGYNICLCVKFRNEKNAIGETTLNAGEVKNITRFILPTSTLFSSIKRLMKTGYIIRTDAYDIEESFFKWWI